MPVITFIAPSSVTTPFFVTDKSFGSFIFMELFIGRVMNNLFDVSYAVPAKSNVMVVIPGGKRCRKHAYIHQRRIPRIKLVFSIK